ncbi:hypothetical protein [Spongiactinospora sp. TRM90649]|uniref:hypothetical protein n=1 Tax=Spongiactinospora sp. TRM90649 TaxID=3031114 RepID=UPI0023F9A4B2|nr:hypothetical protein [Spongiactinospora sp. TRM90649]MDF5755135.1 hypothetical protein [Spongiactinospora sp. TRM90649]
MRGILIGLGVLLALTGCSGIQEDVRDGVQQGTVEGTLNVMGRIAVEEAAGVKLKDELDCVAKPLDGDAHQVECAGHTKDGRKASVKGSVTSVDAAKGIVRGKLALAFDGKDLGVKECVGVC